MVRNQFCSSTARSIIGTLVKDVVAKWGRVDILVNNAAISDNKDILEGYGATECGPAAANTE